MAFTAINDPDWQPDVNAMDWALFKKDTKVSRMVIHRLRPTINFTIPILPQAPRYQAGSAPPSRPVDIELDSDSHLEENKRAFVVDKVILPLEPFTQLDDPRQRRAYYIIGWPDLPAARPVIDCAKAPEYVSPCAIEAWEYQDFLRREEEKEKAETEAAIAEVAAAIAIEKNQSLVEGVAGVAGADPRILPNGKKKPGRKPKNFRLLQARAPTPMLDSEQEELLAKRMQGPSLSTPQKSRIAQLHAEMESMDSVGESMDEGGFADELVRQQLESEARSEIADSVDEDDDEGEDAVDLLRPNVTGPGFDGSSRTERPSSSRTLPAASGSMVTPALRFAKLQQKQKRQPQAVPPQTPASLGSSLPLQTPVSTTPIPLHQKPLPSAQTIVPSIESQTPRAATQGWGQATSLAQAATSFSTQPISSNGHSGFRPTNTFTSLKRAAEHSTEDGTPSTVKGHKKRRKTAKLSSPPPPEPQPKDDAHIAQEPNAELGPHELEPQPEQDYVVKRLEADSILDGIHWFRVRWEGDWPADQNPTWEPRGNISAKLVKSYLKRKADKEAKQAKSTPVKGPTVHGRGSGGHSSTGKGKQQSTLKDWATKFNYSSVSEAFEGKAELNDDGGPARGEDHRADDDDKDELAGDADEFLIVDSKRAADERERAAAAAERRKSLSAHLTANFANL